MTDGTLPLFGEPEPRPGPAPVTVAASEPLPAIERTITAGTGVRVAPRWPTLDALAAEAHDCTRCNLAHQGRTQVVVGITNRDADLMFVGEGPGAEEDRLGLPFVGRSGKLLDQLMAEEMGIDRTQCSILNVVKCRPPDNRDPKPDEIEACRPYLEAQVDLIAPKVIVTLGRFAAQVLLASTDGINKLRGRTYPYRTGVIVPTLHPAAALRGGGEVLAQMRADLVRAKLALAEAT